MGCVLSLHPRSVFGWYVLRTSLDQARVVWEVAEDRHGLRIGEKETPTRQPPWVQNVTHRDSEASPVTPPRKGHFLLFCLMDVVPYVMKRFLKDFAN